MAENSEDEKGQQDPSEGKPGEVPRGDVIIVGPRAQIHIDQGGGKKEGGDEEKGGDKKDAGKKGDDKKKKFKWTPLKIILLVLVVLAVITAGIVYLMDALAHEETDDAYTTAYVHLISARVTSNVIELDVQDNQFVHEGQVLLRLDPRDFVVQVDRAMANYVKAKADFDRVDALKNDVAISKQDYDQTKANLEVTRSQLEDAQNQLTYCTIVAPSGGFIGNRTVNVGNRVTVGGALMAVVQDVWVMANYKETQLGQMKSGQQAEIMVDAIPKKKFRGYIDSFSPGTGATFALLPPDNATGNFTKIVQRVSVKIFFEPDDIKDFRSRLMPGLSVEASVDLNAPLVHQNDDPTPKLSR